MNANLKNEVAEAIEFVLCIGQLKMIDEKKERGNIGEAEIKTHHKDSCEMLEKLLAEKIQISDYHKFADMIQRCDLALMIGAMSNNTDLPKRGIKDMLEKYADGCVRAI